MQTNKGKTLKQKKSILYTIFTNRALRKHNSIENSKNNLEALNMSPDHITLVTKNLTQSYVIFSNETSQSDCLDYRDIKIILADDEHITLLVPPSACSQGHHLSLFVFKNDKQLRVLKKMPNDRSVLKCMVLHGTIEEFSLIDEQIAEVTLKLTDKVMEYWKSMIDAIEKKQENVSQLFAKYRE